MWDFKLFKRFLNPSLLPLAPMHVVKYNKTKETAYIMTPSLILCAREDTFSIIVNFNHEEE